MIRLVVASLAALVFVAAAALTSILCLLADNMGCGDPRMLVMRFFERYFYDEGLFDCEN